MPALPYGGRPGAEEVAVVRAIYDAFARRDVEGAVRHLADDCEFWPAGTARALGRTEAYVGHAGIREYFRDAERVWADLVLEADDIRAAGEGVIVFGRASGRLSDGSTVNLRAVWVWQIRDGLARSMRVSDLGELPW